jgi:BASS family bile acid:Na+ symporter
MGTIISIVLPLSLAFIMFALGVGLRLRDFGRVLTRPLAFLVGALNQIVLLPLVGLLIILGFGLEGAFAVGVMILAACPGGVTSNILTRFAKGDVALSVTLTAVISLTSVITVPILLSFAYTRFLGADAGSINITSTAGTMFALTVIPVGLGMVLRLILPTRMQQAETQIARVASALFVVIVFGALASNWQIFVDNLMLLGPALITMLIALTLIGLFASRFLGRSWLEAKTISIETGVQNAALGLTVVNVAAGADALGPVSLPIAVYGVVMYLIIFPILLIYRRL